MIPTRHRNSILFFISAFFLLSNALASGQSGGKSITEAEYWILVQSTRNEISQILELSDEASAGSVSALSNKWSAISHVHLPSGETIAVDHGYVVGLLKADPPDLDKLSDFLAGLETQNRSRTILSPSPASLDDLQNILSRPEFQYEIEPPNPIEEFIQGLIDRFLTWVADILPEGAGSVLGSIFEAIYLPVAIIILILVFVFIARNMFRGVVAESDSILEPGEGDAPLTADAALKRANQLSRTGDSRTAVRYLYLSALLMLEERGVLRYDRSKTNREYLNTVSDAPNLKTPLKRVVDVFDRVWYGYQEIEPKDFETYSDEVSDLRSQK